MYAIIIIYFQFIWMVKKNQTYSTLGLCQKTAERKSTKSEQSPSSQRPKQEDNSFFHSYNILQQKYA